MAREELERILDKPRGANKSADGCWRRTCAQWGIATTARGKKIKNPEYDRGRYLERRVKELQERLKQAEAKALTVLSPAAAHKKFHQRS